MKAQARFIRAYRYFVMNWNYGGVPVIKNYANASEALVPRNSEEEVKTYINNELDGIPRPIPSTPPFPSAAVSPKGQSWPCVCVLPSIMTSAPAAVFWSMPHFRIPSKGTKNIKPFLNIS